MDDVTELPARFKRRCPYCGAGEGHKHQPDCLATMAIQEPERGQNGALGPRRFFSVSLPPEVQPYEQDLRRFIDAMIHKLAVHSAKGKWEGYTLTQVLEYLRAEEKELTEAVARGNMVEILLESADVANFALIAASIAVEKK